MSLLQIDQVSKRFGSMTAVDKLSLDVQANEFFALLGASGSGKTTLLRILAGFELPQEGRILLEGADITHLAPNRRPLNLMFQSYALFPHMTVAANIAYGLEMEHLARSEIQHRVGQIMEVTELGPLAARKPDQLSGGQRQRVALARALVKRPKVLLLDEPLGALDKKLRAAMQLELKRLQHEVGITFIMVTHDQEEALVMADRIAILRDGRLVQVGTPHEVYEAPTSRYAAGFIGQMNFLALGDQTLAIRPERIRLAPEACDTRTEGRILDRAYHGQDLMLHVATPLSDAPLIVRVTAEQAEQLSLAPGDGIALGWNHADTRIFPT